MPIYNLLEYSQKYSMTSGSLWNYYKNEIDDVDDIDSDGKSFEYRIKIVEKRHKDQHGLVMKETQIDHRDHQYQI